MPRQPAACALSAFPADQLAAACDAVEAIATCNTAGFASAAPIRGVDQAGKPAEPVNRFSSRIVPPLSLQRLAMAMQRGTQCDDSVIAIAVVLMVRYSQATSTALTLKKMHRLFVACLHVAIKAHCDRYFRNDAFAMLAGISLLELNLLEAVLLEGLQWRCLVQRDEAFAFVTAPLEVASAAIPCVGTSSPYCAADESDDDSDCGGSVAGDDADDDYLLPNAAGPQRDVPV